MSKKKRFDVFLSHNSKDKPAVRQLGEELKARGLAVWLDEWELVPGRPWQEAIEEIVRTTCAAAVLVGKDGIGPWQDREMRGCLSEFADRRLPVIPVLLPGARKKPRLPIFLKQFTWVDLRNGITQDGLDRIVCDITGVRPGVAGKIKASLNVVGDSTLVLPHRRLLRDLERSLTDGDLQHSRIGAVVLTTLEADRQLELADNYDAASLEAAIRLSDEYLARIRPGAGVEDWQRDFAQVVTPTIVAVAQSLRRSPDAQAVVMKLCAARAAQLRLKLHWPRISYRANSQKNRIYRACLAATSHESDDVLLELRQIRVVGPD